MIVMTLAFSLCACGDDGEDQTTTLVNSYEQLLCGIWKRNNSDIMLTLNEDKTGTQKQKGIAVKLYWEADADTILIKDNMVGEKTGTPYTLDGNTLTISNEDGTKTTYTRVK